MEGVDLSKVQWAHHWRPRHRPAVTRSHDLEPALAPTTSAARS